MILVQAKSEAILLAARNVDIDTIADFVERQPSTVQQWLTSWRQTRLASIFTGHENNDNACKLSPQQKAEVLEVLAAPPSAQHLPAAFWSPPDLANWLEARFGVVYESASSYHFFLHLAGLSFHKPNKLDQRRADESSISQTIAAIQAQIKPWLADPGWIVLAADEVRIDQEAITRRAWLKRNQDTIIKVNRVRQAQSFIGYLDQTTGCCRLDRLNWQNAATILESLQHLSAAYPDKQICVIWDNASWHKNKLIRGSLGAEGLLPNIHLIAMPPYAPDHNPIEHVWKDTKEHIANIQRHNFEDTITAFETYIASRQFKYTL